MIEMVGHRVKYIPEILYTYIDIKKTSDSVNYFDLIKKYEADIRN